MSTPILRSLCPQKMALAYTLVTDRPRDGARMSNEADEIAVLEEEEKVSNLAEQALWVLIHMLLAIGSWAAMMLLITILKPDSVPVLITLALSFSVPFLVGNIFTRIKQNDMAPYIWLVGLIWFLIVCLWVLDMPTGPNQCYHCDASQKIYLTFFSPTEDSWLIDGEGRLFGTWPAAAWIGYGIGARLALKRKK
jgi:hypothetical protein